MPSKVLIADDAAFMRAVLRDILSAEGYEVSEAVNGRDVCEKFAEILPDLVTVDVAMPELDGISAVRRIVEGYPEARILMISAQAQPSVRERALSAGARGFVAKPFAPEQLLEAVRACLSEAAC